MTLCNLEPLVKDIPILAITNQNSSTKIRCCNRFL
jgi:hypothetical protein